MADDPEPPPTTWLRLPTAVRLKAPAARTAMGEALPPVSRHPPRPPQVGAGSFAVGRVDPATTLLRVQSRSRLLRAGGLALVVLTVIGLAAVAPLLYMLSQG
jgi:hypothetical protein